MKYRIDTPEIMDDPSCETKSLLRTIGHFSIINALFSRSISLASRYLIPREALSWGRPLTVLDAGGGGGDFARALYDWGAGHGLELRITCVDQDRRIVNYAKEKCIGYPAIEVRQADICSASFAQQKFDFVFANHFLHHIPSTSLSEVIGLLNSMALHGLLINDLRRSYVSYAGFALFASLFLRRSFARADGLVSIRKGFTDSELEHSIEEAGLKGELTVGTAFPGRVFVYRSGQRGASE